MITESGVFTFSRITLANPATYEKVTMPNFA